MANKPLNISESAAVQMPMKTVASLIILVAMGVFAYTELTSRLVSLETSRELFENDLLKKSEQVPVDQEQHFLLEDLYKSVEQIETKVNQCSGTLNVKMYAGGVLGSPPKQYDIVTSGVADISWTDRKSVV